MHKRRMEKTIGFTRCNGYLRRWVVLNFGFTMQKKQVKWYNSSENNIKNNVSQEFTISKSKFMTLCDYCDLWNSVWWVFESIIEQMTQQLFYHWVVTSKLLFFAGWKIPCKELVTKRSFTIVLYCQLSNKVYRWFIEAELRSCASALLPSFGERCRPGLQTTLHQFGQLIDYLLFLSRNLSSLLCFFYFVWTRVDLQ